MFLFNKKSKSIEQSVQETKKVKEDYSKQKELINDFIFILEHIQDTNNENLQWKRRQCRIDNEITLAIENYRQKILELDITNNVDI